jgi:hypothetical protein
MQCKLQNLVGNILLIFSALAVAAAVAAADELVLKNGKKLSGTIVGYESDMFRVETEFGFVLVRKDKVATINIAPDAAAKSDKTAEAAMTPATRPTGRKTDASAAPAASAAPPAPEAAATPPAPAVAAAPPPPPVSRPLNDPPLVNIREHLEGNQYVNDTFQFALYKPSDWRVQEDVPRQTGSGVTALGTEDDQNLLLVDRQLWSGAPDLKFDRGEVRLRKTYQEYEKLSESAAELSGLPAVRRTFRGVLDGFEWHGISVEVARGHTLFTIIGLTCAENFQFQQAVLNKMINSFHFLPASSPLAASPAAPQP